jgi:hypothetical protein
MLKLCVENGKKTKTYFEQALGGINSNTIGSLPARYLVCSACVEYLYNTAKTLPYLPHGRK